MSTKSHFRIPRFDGDRLAFADAIVEWLAEAGAGYCDESVTQYEHALQSAALARDRGCSEALVIAALLHDVGHLLADEHCGQVDFLDIDLRHEQIGAQWLARGFVPEVTEPIRWHVAAKRYLCAVDRTYYATLSVNSKRSLVVQGGAMSSGEAAAFIAQPGAEGALELRRIDDLAKRSGVPVPTGETYCASLVAAMRNPWPPWPKAATVART